MNLAFFLRTHFSFQLILSSLIGSLLEAMATPLIVESFSYPNGSLIRQPHSPWAHSSGKEGELQINSDAILLLESNTEDVSIPLFPPGNTTASPDVLYAGFDLTVLELPSGAGNYFAHFLGSSSSSFRGRLFVIPSEDEATGGFDLGIRSGSLRNAFGLLLGCVRHFGRFGRFRMFSNVFGPLSYVSDVF